MMEENQEEIEDQIINEEYKIWKKNTAFLYDLVISHGLLWPSLTVQWLPTHEVPPDCDYCVQKLILGTHTSNNEENHLMIVKVRLPLDSTLTDKLYDDGVKNKEAVGFGLANQQKVEIEIKINHEGEVNRARYMPQQPNVIATKVVTGQVHIFDYGKHPCRPTNDQVNPELRLLGHTKEGYGLSWNPKEKGILLSSSDDCSICVWDIEGASNLNSIMNPLNKYEVHTNVVEDVCWHKFHPKIFGSVSDDKKLFIWDIRNEEKEPTHKIDAHSAELICLDFNPYHEYLLATGSSDKSVALWDMRNLQHKLHSFEQHQDDVTCVQWAPFNEGILASASQDRRILIWDLSRLGEEISQQDMEDGPPELLFIHGGHTSKISDICWNMNDELVMASVADDNILQIWQMAGEIYYSDRDKERKDEAEVKMSEVE